MLSVPCQTVDMSDIVTETMHNFSGQYESYVRPVCRGCFAFHVH